MNNLFTIKPLGKLLQEAGLISAPQLEVALYDSYCYQEMRIGEILASRGWIDSATADFFADKWMQILQHSEKQPLGFYLQEAALLEPQQVELILREQPRTLIRLGSLAVIKGWIKQETLDFFLTSLFPAQATQSPFREPQNYHRIVIDETISDETIFVMDKDTDDGETMTDEVDYEDITWID